MAISKKTVKLMNDDITITNGMIFESILSSKNAIINSMNTIWKPNVPNKFVTELPIDARGKYGEYIVKNILSCYKNDTDVVEYYEGIQGDWDVKFNDIRIEVKTSTLDNQGKFQNENIKKYKLHTEELNPYDVLILIGISPYNYHYKIVRYEDIDFTTLHNRGSAGTGAAYKWDFQYYKYNLLTDERKFYEDFLIASNKG
jgi:hypothetical protein